MQRHGGALAVWSAGYFHAPERPIAYPPQWRFLALRGHLTEALVAPARQPELAIGDGALLAARLLDFTAIAKTHDLGVVGTDADLTMATQAGMGAWAGTGLIDTGAPIEQLLRQVAACRRIAAFHPMGAVLADASNIPHVCMPTQPAAAFEFNDCASALGYEVTSVTPSPDVTREGLIAAIDQAPKPAPVPDAVLDDLAMTVQVLRGAARGLCDVSG